MLAEFFLLFKLWTHIATFLGPCLASGCIWGTPNTRLWVPEPVLKAGSRKTKFLVVRLVYQKQIVQERRDFREGISSRSRHGSSRYADFWYREVWLTVRILCTVLNSKMALYTTGACKCLAEFFLLFKLGPILQHSLRFDPYCNIPGSLALLLVAFALGEPVPRSKAQRTIFGARSAALEGSPEHLWGHSEHPTLGARTGQERDFREGISSRSRHGSSRHADFWCREVWLTVGFCARCSTPNRLATFLGPLPCFWLHLLWVNRSQVQSPNQNFWCQKSRTPLGALRTRLC